MAATQFEAVQRQTQVWVCRDAEGGHATRARQENYQVGALFLSSLNVV